MKITVEFDETERHKVVELFGGSYEATASGSIIDPVIKPTPTSVTHPEGHSGSVGPEEETPVEQAPVSTNSNPFGAGATGVARLGGTATAAPVSTPTTDTDKNGLPWDERIHSSNKKKTKEGVWARRKNVPDDVFANVEAELQNKAAAASPAPIPVPVPPAPAAPVQTVPHFLQPPTPTPPTPATAVGYAEVEALVTEQIGLDATGTFSKLTPVLAQFGVGSLADLQSKTPEIVSEVYYALVEAFSDRAAAQ